MRPKACNDIAAKKTEGKGCIDKAAAAGSEEATLAAASSKVAAAAAILLLSLLLLLSVSIAAVKTLPTSSEVNFPSEGLLYD